MTANTSASARNGGQTSISQRLDAISGTLGDITAAIRENTNVLIGDPEEQGKPFTVYGTVKHGGKTYRRVYHVVASPDVHPRKVALEVDQFFHATYDDPDFYDESDKIPFGEAEGIEVKHVLTIDDDGYPVLLDPEEYA